LEFCKKIKSEFDTSHIPVILLTAKNSPENILKGLEEGADDYISKPFFMKQLLARTENLISSRKLLIEKFNKGSLFNLSDIAISGLDEKFLSAIVDVIENHIADPELNIVFLAKSMGMSHSAIYKKIKAISGLSGNEFIRNIRLKRASQLLKTPGINISEVVYQVGFNNRSYFSKCFQDTFDMTPTQFVASLPV
jgi:AraC-like DNA-binding protein